MYQIGFTKQFKKDLKKIQRDPHKDQDELKSVIALIANREPLPEQNRDHPLTGNYSGYRECHIRPDWLLIYKVDDDENKIYLARTGSHSNLF